MNNHDEKRRQRVIKKLAQASEALTIYRLYLTDADREALWDATVASEHIDNALERLGAEAKTT